MKKIKIFSIISIVVILMAACTQKPESASALLKNEAMQDSVMKVISNDHQLMTKMMTHMMQSPHSMQMMMHNQEMMKNMVTMIDKDTAMSRSMAGMMMGYSNMKGMMMNMMQMNNMGEGNKMKQDSLKGKDHQDHH
ncbi:MAG: hypothetical protein JJE22_13765 [Bacteroidia bacterium]|nr:hypothetical protein [Bacteroidia bacterium]